MVHLADRPVLDTDILIDYLRGAGPGAAVVRALRNELGYRVTAIAAFELALGRSYARDPEPVHALLAVECLSLGARLRCAEAHCCAVSARWVTDWTYATLYRPESVSRPERP